MLAQYATLHYREIIVTDVDGALDLKQSISMLQKIVETDRLPNDYDLLFDLRDIHCDLSASDIFEIISYLYNHPRSFRCKIALLLSTTTDLIKETLLKSCMALRGVEVKLFFNEQNALSWLSPPLTQ